MSDLVQIPDESDDAAELQVFEFHGDRIFLVDVSGKPHVVLRPAIEALGLSYARQFRKLESRSWVARGSARATGADGKRRSMVTVDVPTFLMLLSTVDENRVSNKARLKVALYQREISDAIAGVRGTDDLPPQRAELNPETLRRSHEGWVYVVEFSSGIVKVGQTKRLGNRIDQHVQAARTQGCLVVRSWTSPRHVDFSASEQELISFCAARWTTVVGREYFLGADYDQIVRFADVLTQGELDVDGAA